LTLAAQHAVFGVHFRVLCYFGLDAKEEKLKGSPLPPW